MGRIVMGGLAFLALAIGLLAAFQLFNPSVELPPMEATPDPEHWSFVLPDALAQVTAGRTSLLMLYSGSCGHCTDNLPGVAVLARQMAARGAAVVCVEYRGSRDTCRAHQKQFDLPGTMLPDESGDLCSQLGVVELTLIVVDEHGALRYRGGGEDPAEVERALFP